MANFLTFYGFLFSVLVDEIEEFGIARSQIKVLQVSTQSEYFLSFLSKYIHESPLLCLQNRAAKWEHFLSWCPREPIKVVEVGVQNSSFNQTEITFGHLCHTFVMKRWNLSAKFDIPKIDQNYKNSKWLRQGEFFHWLPDELEFNSFQY